MSDPALARRLRAAREQLVNDGMLATDADRALSTYVTLLALLEQLAEHLDTKEE